MDPAAAETPTAEAPVPAPDPDLAAAVRSAHGKLVNAAAAAITSIADTRQRFEEARKAATDAGLDIGGSIVERRETRSDTPLGAIDWLEEQLGPLLNSEVTIRRITIAEL